jgi:hypothetical protein
MITHATLADLQRQFAALVSAESSAPAEPLLRPLRGAAPRLEVYHHAYRARLVSALRSNYPVLHRALGDDDFAALAMAYLADHPARRPSIRWFGEALVGHVRARPGSLPHPALADLAAMEWALGCSFDAADIAALTFEQLAAVPPADWPAARFGPHPSVAWLDLQWAVEPIWQALTHDADETTDEPEALDHGLLVWRQGLETRWRSVPADEASVLLVCLAGDTFAALCELAAASRGEQAAPWVAAALRRWVDDGLLIWRATGKP